MKGRLESTAPMFDHLSIHDYADKAEPAASDGKSGSRASGENDRDDSAMPASDHFG